MNDRLCGSTNTADGKPCRNKAETCPFAEHRRQPVVATAPLFAAGIEPGGLSGFSADADFLGRADALPGVESGAPGMAGHPTEFADLLDTAEAATGVDEMLCVTPAYTAANKLDALHRRAETGDLQGTWWAPPRRPRSACTVGQKQAISKGWLSGAATSTTSQQ